MKKEKTLRVLTLVLCLCLCGALLCGCGDKADSLWGKTVRVETEPIPAEALDGEDSRCCGVSPDGSKLLIAGGGHSYLWDRESGERLSLTPGDEATRPGCGSFWLNKPRRSRRRRSRRRSLWTQFSPEAFLKPCPAMERATGCS